MTHQFAVFGATLLMGAFVGVVFFVIARAVWFGLCAMKIAFSGTGFSARSRAHLRRGCRSSESTGNPRDSA
ncbi:hypothetical protein ONR57_16315 [Hoyosella sp. YIM 151337]|uniref:hypothetical protein n=1 Tax=Hoyosella sp. YIM 151337 TaxID=2992742 RepID=UPI002235D5ED|nr:hypothetical protein [Hoyosella sp. YIM 151337]MCW4354870.1 hypothetical protein [Hoyosella sp. YIM 151337]